MDPKSQKQMAKMVDAVQPHCDEEITAAMTCSRAGTMSATLLSKVLDGAGAPITAIGLSGPIFLAVGANTIYAFKYKPRWFKFKIKKEIARWPKQGARVKAHETSMMCTFVLELGSGEQLPLEVPIMMGGKELVHAFLDAIGQVTWK
jgi:hypothetical protein